MSMMICKTCERLVDTDVDLDGVWTETEYICTACAEDYATNAAIAAGRDSDD